MARRRTSPSLVLQSDAELALQAAVEDMPDNFVYCRDFGHSWAPKSVHFDDKAKVYDQTLRCGRCKTVRHRLIDSRGRNVSANYDYPDHYLITGAGRLDVDARATIRLAQLQRTVSKKPSAKPRSTTSKPHLQAV